MATRGRKKGAVAAKSAQERKAEFDKRMRNGDLGDPSAPVRSPSVFYISAAAKAVIARNREVLRLSKDRPTSDSAFLELLLLRYEAGRVCGTEESPTGGDALVVGPSATQLRQAVDTLLARRDQLVKEGNQLRRKVNSLTEQLYEEMNPDSPFDVVVDVHCRQPAIHLFLLVKRLEEIFRASGDVREQARQVQEEIGDYLSLLG